MTTLLKWLRHGALAMMVLLLLAVVTVWTLRWFARDEAAHEARALIEQAAPAPTGSNGYAWLAFADRVVPESEMDAALQAERIAFDAWQAGQGERLLKRTDRLAMGHADVGQFESPAAARYPERARVDVPEFACASSALDCLAKVRANADAVRAWLAADAERLALAERSLQADHITDPFPPAIDGPMPAYSVWRLSLNAAALQAVDGDTAGATVRACRLFASSRRHAAHANHLIAKMVPLALAEGSAGLLLSLQRENPGLALPADCDAALAPVRTDDFQVCDAMRYEYRMNATLSAQVDAAQEGWHPKDVLTRLLVQDGDLHTLWLAEGFAPSCRDDFRAAVAEGKVLPLFDGSVNRGQTRCYAALINCVLVEIAQPSYTDYQARLLDHAAKQRLLIAAIAASDGRLPASDIATAAASPGYTLQRTAEGWSLPLQSQRHRNQATFLLPDPPPPASTSPEA